MATPTLAGLKAFTNITDPTDDAELQTFLDAAILTVGHRVGPIGGLAVTERHDGGRSTIVLRRYPVAEVNTVTESGATVDSSGWVVSDAGVLTRLAGGFPGCWRYGVQNIQVEYTAGWNPVPDDLEKAVYVVADHLWDTQRGKTGAFQQIRGLDDDAPVGAEASALALLGALPRRAQELMQPYLLAGIA